MMMKIISAMKTMMIDDFVMVKICTELSCENKGDEDSDKDCILYRTGESHNLMWMLSEF